MVQVVRDSAVNRLIIEAGGGGVTSLNSETGALTLTSNGGTVTITTPTASTINLEAGAGSVTTTGSPASGNLTKFSGASSITNGDLAGDITTSGALTATLATVNSNVGSFTNASITVNGKGLVTAASSGTAPVTSVSGTSNRITSSGGATPVIDISASYVGQASITTLGTIGTGVWQGTKIGLAYGGTNADLSATGGSSQVLKQTSVGGAVTVAQLAASDLSNGTTGSGAVVLASNLTNPRLAVVGFTSFDSTAVATGKTKGFVTVPYAGAITGWNITTDAGTCTVKTWKIATGTAKPTIANVISTSGVSLSSGTAVRSSTVTDFTSTTVSAGDIFAWDITAVSGVKELTFELEITKT